MTVLTGSLQLAIKSLAAWEAANQVLLEGQPAIVVLLDGSRKVKFGDGVTAFNSLPYFSDSSPFEITKTQANLLETAPDSGIWYLPFLDEAGTALPDATVPLFIKINNIQFTGYQADFTVTPPRIYGFIDNTAKTITIKIK